jgi:hypothetical protein
MHIETELSKLLKEKGFHGFSRHVKTGLVAFFGMDGYKLQYIITIAKTKRLDLTCNGEYIGEFCNANDLANFLLG